MFFGILFRYGLNTLFSLFLIYLLFKEKKLVVFSAWIYLSLFVILVALFFGILNLDSNPDYLVLFYVRRFLIQPLFLFLFIAAFYYQKRQNNSLS
ncbi:MAG: exosortase F system-associated protein [Flavobacterium sp.]|nr:exosortase F system-associated protein [Flavobacterium sp.]